MSFNHKNIFNLKFEGSDEFIDLYDKLQYQLESAQRTIEEMKRLTYTIEAGINDAFKNFYLEVGNGNSKVCQLKGDDDIGNDTHI